MIVKRGTVASFITNLSVNFWLFNWDTVKINKIESKAADLLIY